MAVTIIGTVTARPETRDELERAARPNRWSPRARSRAASTMTSTSMRPILRLRVL
jgi:hypothetical protein